MKKPTNKRESCTCEMCGRSEPEVCFTEFSDICDGCAEGMDEESA